MYSERRFVRGYYSFIYFRHYYLAHVPNLGNFEHFCWEIAWMGPPCRTSVVLRRIQMITFPGVCCRSSRTVGETWQMMTIPQTMKILHFRSVQIWMTYNLDSRRRENVFIRRDMKAGLSSWTNYNGLRALNAALFAPTANFDDRHLPALDLPSSRRPADSPFTVAVTWLTCWLFRYSQNVQASSLKITKCICQS